MISNMVGLKHNKICIFDVEFYRSDIFDNQKSLMLVKLNDKLIFGHILT